MWQFTHEDVKNGVIHFVASDSKGNNSGRRRKGANDSFGYRLVAPGVQPANGVFEFNVAPKVMAVLAPFFD